MDKDRIDYFKKLTKKQFKDFGDNYFQNFTNTELEEIIKESPLSERDRQIVTMRIIKAMSYEDIANRLNTTVRTCFSNMFTIELCMFQTCIKMFIR